MPESGFFFNRNFPQMKLYWQIVRLKLKETFSIAYGDYSYRDALIVTLEKSGSKGYGECTSIDYYHINLDDFDHKLQQIQQAVQNQKITHPNDFYLFLLTLGLPSFLRSALDCAYWDLYGKLENKSFHDLNRIVIAEVPESSLTISVDSVENQISKIKKSAWSKFKVKCNHFEEQAIVKLAALEQTIALDSNGSFTQDDCLWLQNNAMVTKFSYLEQPMKPGAENYSILKADSHANWMADEDCQDISDLEKLPLHYRSVNIKLVKCGGLTPALELIQKARALHFNIMIGCMTETTVGISAGAVLAPLCNYADLDGANLIANDLASGSQVLEGKIRISEKPGLGIEMK